MVITVDSVLSRSRLLHCACVVAILAMLAFTGATAQAEETYHYYFGNTHSHTSYSDGGNSTPAEHFKLAKEKGFDFYAITNHALAKYPNFTPETYEETKRQADIFIDSKFVSIVGFEFSENDGPGGKGHLCALNTASYLDATGSKVNLPVFYNWLAKNQTTTIAASFNHAGPATFNSYGYFTKARRNAITMFEMINGGKLKYDGFLAALNKGWRVAPIAAMDNHGIGRIKTQIYRTGVLAPSLTRETIMQAMRARRVYCTWDRNLRVMFSVNGSIMGSVISDPENLNFGIDVSDPDIDNPKERITKIEIVGKDGKLVSTKDFSAHTATWNTTINPEYEYYFLKIYAGDKTDGPTAYSAPVWIEKPAAPAKSDEKKAANSTEDTK